MFDHIIFTQFQFCLYYLAGCFMSEKEFLQSFRVDLLLACKSDASVPLRRVVRALLSLYKESQSNNLCLVPGVLYSLLVIVSLVGREKLGLFPQPVEKKGA